MDSEKYKKSFYELIKSRFNREADFGSIEKGLEHLRNGDALTYADLELIGDERYWPFKQYWMWPAKEQIQDKLKETKEKFIDPVRNEQRERELIRCLSAIFRNLSLVSIVMRFVWPEYYAIYSRPNLKVLRVERGANDEAEYMNYIRVMRLLKRSFGVERVADVDIIVWAIAKREEAHAEFFRILAEQLPENLTPGELILSLHDNPLKVAQVYLRKGDYKTSSFWASQAFESTIIAEHQRLNGIGGLRKADLKTLINELCSHSEYENWKGKLHELRKPRNKAIHPEHEFTQDNAKKLIKGVKKLKKRAEKLREKARKGENIK